MAERRCFLHLAPQSDFEHGIFLPYNTVEEAEAQAAWDIYNGTDPALIEGIFEAEYATPKFGWTRTQLGEQADVLPAHLDPEQRKKLRTLSQIAKAAPGVAKRLVEDGLRAQEDYLLGIDKAVREGRGPFKNAVPGNAYSWMTGGTATATPAALGVATAKTLVLILAAAANQPAVTEVGISFDGVTASAVPVLVELVSGTGGTAGTPRTTLAVGKQLRGWPAQSSQTTCGDNYTGEPGTQLVNRKWLVSPNGGLFVIQFPLGREPTGVVTATTDAKTWSVRATAPAAVNAHAYVEYEE